MITGEKGSRLSKIARELNVGITTLVDFLHKQGFKISTDPNTKIEAEVHELLEKQFRKDHEARIEADKVNLRHHHAKNEAVSITDLPTVKKEVEEPDADDSISILRGLKERYETHHQVRIKDEAIIAAVELSQRYITDRFLPDKAIDLIDEAASKLRLEINSVPEELDEIERKIRQLEIEREAIKRENDKTKLKDLNQEIANLSDERNRINAKWQSEKEVVENIQKK